MSASELTSRGDQDRLLGAGRFRALLAVVGVAFTIEGVLQPVVPLLILSMGGSAVMVGVVSACFALPSLPLRPLIGRAVDRGSIGRMYRLATGSLLLSQVVFAVPLLAMTVVARTIQGVAWAFMSTTNNVVMARLAPPGRRAEASSYYNMMTGLGYFIGAPIGVATFTTLGPEAPFVITVSLAIALVVVAPRIAQPRPTAAVMTTGVPGQALFERAAIPSMLIIAAFASAQSLFMAFAPFYAATVGASTDQLVTHYATYGAVLILAQPVVGRISDRFGRRRGLLVGCSLGGIGLLLPAVVPSMASFTVGAAVYGTAFAIVTPAAVAVAIDLASPSRLGSTVATYSLGFQTANGLGGALWGTLIALGGFPWPLIVAVFLTMATAGLSWHATSRLHPTRVRTGG